MRKVSGWVALLVVAFAGSMLAGCGISRSGGEPRLRSEQGGVELRAALPTRVYSSRDADTVDLYMTDLPPEVWEAGADVSNMSGMLLHVHMFIRPKAGRTPIADTASTCIVRCMVLANGEIGVYGGGGFFVNSGRAGEKTFGGTVRDATMRLISATGGFNDRLGVSSFSGAVSGRQDAATAQALERAMRALAGETRPVE